MLKITSLVVLVVLCGLLSVGSAENAQPGVKVMNFIAVMDLKCGKGIDLEQCRALTDVLIDELVSLKKYTVIDRANRDKILAESGFQQTGCVDESCTIEAGRQLGVGKLVVGSVTMLGETYLVNLQLLNVETAAVENSTRETCEKCKLDDLIASIANAGRKLMGEPPSAPQPTPNLRGPDASSTAITDAKGATIPGPPSGKALVIFYRSGSRGAFGPSAIGYKINEGQNLLGKILPGQCFSIVADPGSHTFWAKGDKRQEITLDLQAGSVYFVEMTVAPSPTYVSVRLFQATREQGLAAVKQCVHISGSTARPTVGGTLKQPPHK